MSAAQANVLSFALAHRALWAIAATGVLILAAGYRTLRRYFIFPLKMWGETIAAEPAREAISLDALPDYASQAVLETSRAFASLGFVAAEHTRTTGAVRGGEGYRSIWISRDGAITALCIFIRMQRSQRPKYHRTVAFITRFDDDTALATRDGTVAQVHNRDPKIDTIRWPDAPDARRLLELHRKRVARIPDSRRVRLMTAEDAIKETRDASRRTMMRQVKAGLYRLVAEHNEYRRTLLGAYVTTWRVLWPLKQMQQRAEARRLREALAACGMSSEDQPVGV